VNIYRQNNAWEKYSEIFLKQSDFHGDYGKKGKGEL
jgi:hypothetical protein